MSERTDAQGFSTHQLHAGAGEDPLHARRNPMHLLAGFGFDSSDEARDRFAGADGCTCTRVGHPTTDALERRLAALEGGTEALLVTRTTRLGDVRPLVLHPAGTTRTGRTEEERAAAAIGDGLLRLSIGIEDVEDLLDGPEVGLLASAAPIVLAAAS